MKEKLRKNAKNVFILLLLLSLALLTYINWFGNAQAGHAWQRQVIRDIFGGIFGASEREYPIYMDYEEYDLKMSILAPARVAVRGEEGLSYITGGAASREIFERVGAALGNAVKTAANPRMLSQQQWRGILTGSMLLFDFEGEIPLDILSAVIGVPVSEEISIDTRYVILSVDGSRLQLVLKAANSVGWAYETQGSASDILALINEYALGSAFFSFEDALCSRYLPDDFIVTKEYLSPQIVEAVSLIQDYTGTAAERIINSILQQFGYNPYTAGYYIEKDDTRVYVDEFSTLRFLSGGKISYVAAQEEAYDPEAAVLAAADRILLIEDAAKRMESLTKDDLGDASLYIIKTEYDSAAGQYRIFFGCAVDGIPIVLEDGYYARLEYTGHRLTSLHMTVCGFYKTGEETKLLPALQAAAAVGEKSRAFALYYTPAMDSAWRGYGPLSAGGGNRLIPQWHYSS